MFRLLQTKFRQLPGFVQSYIKFQVYAGGIFCGFALIVAVLFPDAEKERDERRENYGFELFNMRKTLKDKFGIEPLRIDIEKKDSKEKAPAYDVDAAANYDVERRRRIEEMYNIKQQADVDKGTSTKS